jgi:hypothetical protein
MKGKGLRPLAYLWAAPATLLGLLLLVLASMSGGRARRVQGVLEVHGGLVRWLLTRWVPIAGGASAITLGHVVVGRDADCLERCREHEQVHVRQYERWGPLMIPAYFASSLVAWLRGRHYYLDNAFERAARGAAISPARVPAPGSAPESRPPRPRGRRPRR